MTGLPIQYKPVPGAKELPQNPPTYLQFSDVASSGLFGNRALTHWPSWHSRSQAVHLHPGFMALPELIGLPLSCGQSPSGGGVDIGGDENVSNTIRLSLGFGMASCWSRRVPPLGALLLQADKKS